MSIQNLKYSKTKILKEQLKIMGHNMSLAIVLYTMTQNEKQRKVIKKYFDKKGKKAVFLKSVEWYYKTKQKLSFQKDYSMFSSIKNIFERSYALGKTSLQYFDYLFSKFLLIKGVGATDVGLIGYFNAENCPEGWEECRECEGRFLLGAGKYINTTEDGRNEAAEYNVGDTGGEIKHKLTIEEMPEHKHRTVASGGYEKYSTQLEAVGNNLTSIGGASWSTGQLYTAEAGGDQPHNNMPPYIVWKACKKIKDTVEKDIQELEEKYQNIDTKVTQMSTEEWQKAYNDLEKNYNQLSNKITGLNITGIEKDITEIEVNIKNIQDEMNKLNLTQVIIDVNTVKDDNEHIAEDIKGYQVDVQNLKTSIDQLKKSIKNMTENINSMENIELKNSIDNVKKDLENTNTDIKDLKVQLDYSLGKFSGLNDTALALSIIGCIGTLGNLGVTIYQCCKKK